MSQPLRAPPPGAGPEPESEAPAVQISSATRGVVEQVRRMEARRALRERLISIFSPILILLVWEGLSRSGVLDIRFFPPPSSIAGSFVSVIRDGSIFSHVWATLFRVLAGVILGGVAGVVAGLAMGMVRFLRVAMMPILAVTMPIPKIALLPLLILLLGLGDGSKIALVAIAVFFIMVYNTAAGVVGIPAIYVDVGRSFEAGRLDFYRTVAIPGALPLMLTGLKLSYAVALLVVVPAEWSGVKTGLGFFTNQAWQIFDIPSMYVGLVVLGILGYLGGLILEELERRLVPWRH